MGGIFKDSNLGRDLSVNFFNFSVLFEIEVCQKKSVNGLSAPGPGLGGFQVQSWSISKSVAGNRCLLQMFVADFVIAKVVNGFRACLGKEANTFSMAC